MDVLNDDDRSVYHGANGHRDSTERHDVGGEALIVHRDERQEDCDRYGQNRNQGALRMKQEQENNQAHHNHLFDERVGQGFDRFLDESRPVVRYH